MKKLKLLKCLGICLSLLLMIFTFTACGGSGDDEKVHQGEQVGFVKYVAPEGLFKSEEDSSDSTHKYCYDDFSIEISTFASSYLDYDEFVKDKRDKDMIGRCEAKFIDKIDGIMVLRGYDYDDGASIENYFVYINGQEAKITFTFLDPQTTFITEEEYMSKFLENVSFDWKMLGVNKPENINRFEEGFTLEEAKASTAEYGTVFIKRGDKYYPSVVADYIKLAGTGSSCAYFVDEADGDRPVIKLSAGDKLVDVVGEQMHDKVKLLEGTSGYTTPMHPILLYGRNDSGKVEWYGSSYETRYTYYPSDICRTSIVSVPELQEVNGVDLINSAKFVSDDLENIYNRNIDGLLHLEADPFDTLNVYLVNASAKGEEVKFGYFDGTEYKEGSVKANLKYYNLPTTVKEGMEDKEYKITQSKSREGFVEYDISKLPNGLYCMGYNLFEVAK